MDGSELGVVMMWAGLVILAVIPVSVAFVARRRSFGLLGWVCTVVAFAVVVAALSFWASPVVVDGVYCFTSSPAIDGLIPDRTVLSGDGAVPLDFRLECSALAQRIVVGWGVVIVAALAGWVWLVRRLPQRPARR